MAIKYAPELSILYGQSGVFLQVILEEILADNIMFSQW